MATQVTTLTSDSFAFVPFVNEIEMSNKYERQYLVLSSPIVNINNFFKIKQ